MIREPPPAAPDFFVVGREPELARIEECWERVRHGVPATVFVSGEAGIGKTTLVRRFCARLEPTPWLCVGRCIPQQREAEPYMPVLEALASLADTEERSARRLQALARRACCAKASACSRRSPPASRSSWCWKTCIGPTWRPSI